MRARLHKAWESLRQYRFNSVFVRSFLLISLSFLLLLGIALGMLFGHTNRNVLAQVGEVSTTALQMSRERIEAVFRDARLISAQLSLDDTVNAFLYGADFDDRQTLTVQVSDQIRQFTGVFSYLDTIYVYAERRDMLVSNLERSSLSAFEDQGWVAAYHALEASAWLPMRIKADTYPYVMTYVHPVYVGPTRLGAIVLNLDVAKLEKLIIDSQTKKLDQLLLYDEADARVIFNTNHAQLREGTLPDGLLSVLTDDASPTYQIMQLDGIPKLVTRVSSTSGGWTYASVMDLWSYEESIAQTVRFALRVGLIILLLSLLLALFISIHANRPVTSLLTMLSGDGAAGDALPLLPGQTAKSEADALALRILQMLSTNNSLKERLETYMALRDEAQMHALQSQINPHFLFNTLENIRWMAVGLTKGENEVSEMVMILSELMRRSLDTGRRLIPIRDEVDHAKLYLAILLKRYAGRLTVLWDVDEAALDAQTVSLSLQPVIENAVYHGIKPLAGPGILRITIGQDPAHTVMTIEDNGAGIPADALAALNDDMALRYTLSPEHIGLRNINQRIKLAFGEAYGLRMQTGAAGGVVVTILLPPAPVRAAESPSAPSDDG